ncbi:MAG TPA: LptA/OstA family protein [Limnochordia bacterium]
MRARWLQVGAGLGLMWAVWAGVASGAAVSSDQLVVQVFGPPDAVSCRTERLAEAADGAEAGVSYRLTCHPQEGHVEVRFRDVIATGAELVFDQARQRAVLMGDVTFQREDAEGRAERLEIDGRASVFTLSGSVRLMQGGRTAAAEQIVYDQAQGVVEMRGDVRVEQTEPAFSFTAARVVFDMTADTLSLYGSSVEFRAPIEEQAS